MPRWLDPVHGFVKSRWFYPVVFVACLTPGALLAYRFCQFALWDNPDALGANPAETLLHGMGRNALAILLVTLSITPLRRLTGWNKLQKVRRMLGVWSFAYALLHLSMYLVFDQNCYSASTCDFHAIWVDLLKRRFTFVGMFTLSILAVLAITSTNGMMRRLGRRWQALHRLVYVAAIAGIVHFAWGQKSDITEPLEWGAYLAVLLGFRVWFAVRKRRAVGRLKPAEGAQVG